MKKILFASLAIMFISSMCFGMGGTPPSAYSGQPTKVVTGEVVSIDTMYRAAIKMDVVDNDKNKTEIFLQYGTTDRYFNPSNKKLEITYFVAGDGRNIALTANEVTKEAATAK